MRFLKTPPHCLKGKATPAQPEAFLTHAAREGPRILNQAVNLVISPLADAADGEAVPGRKSVRVQRASASMYRVVMLDA